MAKKTRRKYTKQNIRKRKKDRTTKRKKHKRIGGLRRTKSLKQLNSNTQIEFKTCNGVIIDNCVKKLQGKITSIMFNNEEYEVIQNQTFSGGYGMIYMFKSEQNNKLAVKTFSGNTEDFNEEKNIAKIINKLLLNTHEDRFGVVPTYYHNDLEIIIMHYKNFDINQLLENANIPIFQKIKIYKEVVECIKHLTLEGLFYGDLKFGNVLIQGPLYGPYKVYLGDIGSIAYIPNLIGKDIKEEETISKQIAFTIPYKVIKTPSILNQERIYEFFDVDPELPIEEYEKILCSFFHQILSFLVMLIFHNTNTIDITLFFFNNDDWELIENMKDDIMEQVKDKNIVTETETLSCESLFENFFFPDPDTFNAEWQRRMDNVKSDNNVEGISEGEIRKQAIKSILEDFENLNYYPE